MTFFFIIIIFIFMELSTSTRCVNLHKRWNFFLLLFFKRRAHQNCVKHKEKKTVVLLV